MASSRPALCPVCGQVHAPGASGCQAREAALHTANDSAQKPTDIERRLANRTLGKAVKTIQRVRVGYVVLACLAAVGVVGSMLAGGADVTAGRRAAAILTSSAAIVACAAAALLLERAPFALALALACFVTLMFVLGVASGRPVDVLVVLLLAGCWSSAVRLVGVRRMLDQYPDVVAAQLIAGRRPRRVKLDTCER